MIPLKLQLKNFLSYGTSLQMIDFGPYPLICLSGKNGHGKSALLDAMTWALWGQARKLNGVAKSDIHLVRLGQTTMMVIFDFIFNGTMYRIKREFLIAKNGTHHSALEFGIADAKGTIKVLTEKTIRATQQKIEALLGIDFESFINSAFLRQGHANEFSKKSPRERKEILAAVLQLDSYEILRKAAQDEFKKIQDTIAHHKQTCERINQSLIQESLLLQKKEQLRIQFEIIINDAQQLQHLLQQLLNEKNELITKKQECSYRLAQLEQQQQEKIKLEKQLHNYLKEWHDAHRLLLTIASSSDIEQKKYVLNQQLTNLQQQQQALLLLKEEYLKIKEEGQQKITALHEHYRALLKEKEIAFERLCAQQHHQKSRNAEAQEQYQMHQKHYNELITEQQKNTACIETLTNKEKLTFQERQFEKRKLYYHHWTARLQMIQNEHYNIVQKQTLTKDSLQPSCPLCEQNLSASRKRFLQTKFNKSAQSNTCKQKRLTHLLLVLKELLIEQRKTFAVLQNEYQQRTILENKQKELIITLSAFQMQLCDEQNKIENYQKEIMQTDARKIEQNKELQELRSIYQQKCEAITESIKKECNNLETAIVQHSYKSEDHKKLLHLFDQLQKQETFILQYARHKKEQEKRTHELRSLIATLKTYRTLSLHYKEMQKNYDIILEKITALNAQEQEYQKKLHSTFSQKEQLLQEKGSNEHAYAQLQVLKKEFEEQQLAIAALNEQAYDYQLLATAFSKDGIQALLIEEVIPEIEHEANELLAKLTNNQAHLTIESLRDLKKGGTKETLDINISDPMGIRPYELFSGGEAFRIDFALRIAISKLLARRAGTSLQTLIIDEGFGSQDEEGLGLLMDALHKIQYDFAKIIIVSHLPTMKDQFPVHFFVQKGAQGSTIRIMEQG